MHKVQRPPAVLLVAAIIALVGYSSAATRAAAPGDEIHSRGGMAIAQADKPAATSPVPAKPASDAPVADKPQGDKPADKPVVAAPVKAVYPTVVDPKYAHELGPLGRLRTCADQFDANKATNSNAGMKWIDRSGGYYLQCSRLLKGKS
jgi:hypothetical protein